MFISNKGLNLIKHFESLQLKAYKCSANVWTIGYGHTKNVKEGDRISEDQANYFLMQDLYSVERAIIRHVKTEINQNQFDALCSLIFNIGITAFKDSTLLNKLNNNDFNGASNEFKRWNRVNGIVMRGLIRRRQAEEDLFNAIS